MDVTTLKYSIIERLIRTNDEKLLERVAKLMKSVPVDYPTNELKPMSVEELNERIEESRRDVAAGRVYSTQEMRAYFQAKALD